MIDLNWMLCLFFLRSKPGGKNYYKFFLMQRGIWHIATYVHLAIAYGDRYAPEREVDFGPLRLIKYFRRELSEPEQNWYRTVLLPTILKRFMM